MAAAGTHGDLAGPEWSDVVDNLPIGVFRSTPAGRILLANRALADLLGYDVAELLGVNSRDLYVDPAPRDANVTATEQGADRFHFEAQLHRSDGSIVEVRVRARVRRSADGAVDYYEGIIEDLGERRRLDRALRFEEAIVGAAFDESSAGMLLLDGERKVLRVNDALCAMLGCARDEVLGILFEPFVHPAEATQELRRFDEVLNGVRKSYTVERRILHSAGHDIWVLLTVSAISDESGEVVAVLEQAIDITERRAAEDALLRSEASKRAVVEAIGDPIFVMDRDGVFLEFYPGPGLDPAVPPEAFLGKRLVDTHGPDVGEVLTDAVRRVVDWSERETVEYPMEIDGVVRWFAAALSPVASDQAIAVVVEISDARRKVEAGERWRRHAEAMLSAVPHHLVVVSGAGEVLELLPGSASTTRLALGEWVGRTASELLPGLADRIVGLIGEVLATGEMRRVEFPFTTDVERIYEAVFSPAGDDRVVAAVRDITTSKATETGLRAELSARDEFVAAVSHELRNPLATVVGLATEIRDGLDDFSRDELADLIGLIADQGGEMAGVVDDLLVSTRADLAKLDVTPVSMDAVGEARAVLAASRGNATLVAPATAAVVFADPARVRQIVRNLVANAYLHGGRRVEVEVTPAEDGFCRLRVRDDGPSIPEPMRGAMFTPYERGEAKASGSGLGLTVARKLARLMGGDLTYDHSGGWGTFTLTLPAATD